MITISQQEPSLKHVLFRFSTAYLLSRYGEISECFYADNICKDYIPVPRQRSVLKVSFMPAENVCVDGSLETQVTIKWTLNECKPKMLHVY